MSCAQGASIACNAAVASAEVGTEPLTLAAELQ